MLEAEARTTTHHPTQRRTHRKEREAPIFNRKRRRGAPKGEGEREREAPFLDRKRPRGTQL